MAPVQYRFRDLSTTTRIVRWLLTAVLISQFVLLPVFFFGSEWLDDARRLPPWARAGFAFAVSHDGEIVLAVVWTTMFLACFVLGLRWIYLANANAHALGAEGMRFTPGWAAGWYFIPVANLWMPYRAMKEIWQTSASRTDWRDVRTPALLRWWWAFWLLSTSIQFQFDPDDPDERVAMMVFLSIFLALFTAQVCAFWAIAGRVWAMQLRRREADTDIRTDARGTAPM